MNVDMGRHAEGLYSEHDASCVKRAPGGRAAVSTGEVRGGACRPSCMLCNATPSSDPSNEPVFWADGARPALLEAAWSMRGGGASKRGLEGLGRQGRSVKGEA